VRPRARACRRRRALRPYRSLAKGRFEGRIVRDYLEGLRATRPKRGRSRVAETVTARITKIAIELPEASLGPRLNCSTSKTAFSKTSHPSSWRHRSSTTEKAPLGSFDCLRQQESGPKW
jgi:hypothetical protein